MQLLEDDLFGLVPPVAPVEGTNTLKASLFTLVIVCKDVERAQHCQGVVHLIAKKFPCKIIFVTVDPGAHESFLRQFSTTRTIADGPGAISCDVVSIQVSPDQLHIVPFLITPELVADLPVFLLLGSDPADVQMLVSSLEVHVSRIVFDALRIPNVEQFAQKILALPERQKYVDLNWARTKPWREALSKVFNSADALSDLMHCGRLEFRYSRRPGTSYDRCLDTQAIYLQAWIANRLRWQLVSVNESANEIQLVYATNQHETVVVLSPADSDFMEEGSVTSVELRGQKDVHYLLNYDRDDRHIAVHASCQDRCEMPYTIFVGSFQRGRTLPTEIFQQAASEHYLPMLGALAQPLWNKDRSVAVAV
jgi:glucose-6-phosphate dehydrogenase assembly protein OpcA